MRVLLVDDHFLFREGLASLLSGQPDISVVGLANGVQEAVAYAGTLEPDLILMDFSLPDGNGLEASQAILKKQPAVKIVFLTVHDDDERLFAAIRSGASGYLLKNVPLTSLLEYLRGVIMGEAAISRDMTGRVLKRFAQLVPPAAVTNEGLAGLTSREVEILRELESGASNRQIAERFFISERTVKNHVSHILSKLNVANRHEASKLARGLDLSHGEQYSFGND